MKQDHPPIPQEDYKPTIPNKGLNQYSDLTYIKPEDYKPTKIIEELVDPMECYKNLLKSIAIREEQNLKEVIELGGNITEEAKEGY